MKTIVKGKNLDVPERVRQYAERKVHRIERLLDASAEATVELSVEQHRSADDSHIVDVTLVVDGQPVRGRAVGPSHRVGLDEVIDKLERQAVELKERPRQRARPEAEKALLRRIADGTAEARSDRRIVKVKRFAIEPMFEEDAAARMDELGHQFFVFVNAETEHVSVLYRRNDGDLGLIEPILGGGYTPGRTRRGRDEGNGRQ